MKRRYLKSIYGCLKTLQCANQRLPPGVWLLLLLLGGCGSGVPGDKSLLLVVFDTTRVDHLSAYGYGKRTTPHLERLAARGARFDHARSASSLTPVSAASFLTGELPAKTGVRSLFLFGKTGLSPRVTTLAEMLRESGRATAGFVSSPPMGHRYGFDRGFDFFDDDVTQHVSMLRSEKVGNVFQRRADVTTDRALAWLQSVDVERPFGLLVHFFDAHDPSLVPPRSFLSSRVSFDLPKDLNRRKHLGGLLDGAAPGRGGPRAKDLVELYDAEIEYMDSQLGRLLDALEASGRIEETLVVVLADHGESLGQHDFWTHGLMWDEQLHVPLIFAGPGVPEGVELKQLVSLTDLIPSLAKLMAFETPRGLHGRSFAGLFDPRLDRGFLQRPVFSEVHNSPKDKTGRPQALFAVTAWPWKMIKEPGGKTSLFDLAADPDEIQDLYRKDHPKARMLEALLGASGMLEEDGASHVPKREVLDPQEREVLEKLGYL